MKTALILLFASLFCMIDIKEGSKGWFHSLILHYYLLLMMAFNKLMNHGCILDGFHTSSTNFYCHQVSFMHSLLPLLCKNVKQFIRLDPLSENYRIAFLLLLQIKNIFSPTWNIGLHVWCPGPSPWLEHGTLVCFTTINNNIIVILQYCLNYL